MVGTFMMRLLTSGTSPFGRKVRLCIHELGLDAQVTLVLTEPASEALGRENPLNKVPALVLEGDDAGTALFDSRVICEYLDQLAGGPKLFPAVGPARWLALRQQALADGLCDAAVLCLLESRRPANLQSPDWVARQKKKIRQGLAELERRPPGNELSIGTLAILVALGYLDFRFAADDWRAGHPTLATWFSQASARDSFRLTTPPA
jgi:glutathione S-transferase